MQQRQVDVDGLAIATYHHASDAPSSDSPLLIGVHGGTYTSEYFGVAGGSGGSFIDVATRNGFDFLTVDRPGYGASDALSLAPQPVRR